MRCQARHPDGRRAQNRAGVSAFDRQDFLSASRTFIPLAEQGAPGTPAYLHFTFAAGRGVPQNYTEALDRTMPK